MRKKRVRVCKRKRERKSKTEYSNNTAIILK